jgi:hypothetical protein
MFASNRAPASMRERASIGKAWRAKELLAYDALRSQGCQKRSPNLMGTNCILPLNCEMRWYRASMKNEARSALATSNPIPAFHELCQGLVVRCTAVKTGK